jgi:hypothetical protein
MEAMVAAGDADAGAAVEEEVAVVYYLEVETKVAMTMRMRMVLPVLVRLYPGQVLVLMPPSFDDFDDDDRGKKTMPTMIQEDYSTREDC